MKKVIILGAHGQIAQLATKALLTDSEVQLTLFLRNSGRLNKSELGTAKVIEGDTGNLVDLKSAIKDQDIVYANLSGSNIEQQAKNVVQAMAELGVKRLIWISTLGIYDEVPGAFGQWNHQMLDDGYLPTYAAAAKIVEQSDLDYTIIRPAWLDNKEEIDYELTQKGEPFKGTEVSRQSIAALVKKIIDHPTIELRHSVGVNKPNTDGSKPSWY